MSVPHQKVVTIDKTNNLKSNFLRIDNDYIINACKRLSPSGFKAYLYFVTKVPQTYDGKIINEKVSRQTYDLSPKSISNKMEISVKSAEKAILELEKMGYLRLIKGNYYQFNDYVEEDRCLTIEEFEEIKNYNIEDSIKFQQETRREQLIQKKQILEDDNKEDNITSSDRKLFDWEDEGDEEIYSRIK